MSTATEKNTETAAKKAPAKAKKAAPKATSAKKSLQFPYAVIRTGGKQYRVAEGEMILVEKLLAEPGSTWTTEDVLFVASGPGAIKIGQPTVAGAKVTFEVLQQTLDKKILIRHSRRRQNSRKSQGHRQPQTRIVVKSIVG